MYMYRYCTMTWYECTLALAYVCGTCIVDTYNYVHVIHCDHTHWLLSKPWNLIAVENESGSALWDS